MLQVSLFYLEITEGKNVGYTRRDLVASGGPEKHFNLVQIRI